MHSGYTSKRHTLVVVIIAVLLISFATTLLVIYWSRDSVHMLKIEHFIKSNFLNIKLDENNKAQTSSTKAQEVPVLLYHGIQKVRTDNFNISEAEFYDQLTSLKNAGYSTIDMSTYIKFINGELELPEKSIMITFDDGRKDSYYRADPLLKKLNFKAIMFLTSGDSIVAGSNYYIDKHELNTMSSSGRWDIEAHADYEGTRQIKTSANSYGNFFGNLRWIDNDSRLESKEEYAARISKELTSSKSKLEAYIGQGEIIAFAYPFGDYAQASSDKELSDTLLSTTKKHYSQAFIQFRTGEPYSSNYRDTDGLISRRIEVDPSLSGSKLVDLLHRSTAKAIPYTATLSEKDGWRAEWGDLSYDTGSIKISSKSTSTSGAVYLDGTRNMNSYASTARIKSGFDANTSIKLVALYNKNRYVGCSYSASEVRIESLIDDSRSIVASSSHTVGDLNGHEIGVQVRADGVVMCKLDNKTHIEFKIENNSSYGGPAIIVWHPHNGKASISIDKFGIESATYVSEDKF